MGRRRWDEDEGGVEREYGWLILDIIVFFSFSCNYLGLLFLDLLLSTSPDLDFPLPQILHIHPPPEPNTHASTYSTRASPPLQPSLFGEEDGPRGPR